MDDITTLLDNAVSIIDTISIQLIDHQDDLTTYYTSFESRNDTFFINQDRIANFSTAVSCNNSAITTFIATFNETSDRLNILIQNYEINLLNFTLLLSEYNSLVNQTEIFLTTNCSAIFELVMLYEDVEMEYEANLVVYNATVAACEDCADDIADSTARFITLQTFESNLLNDSSIVFNNVVTLLNTSGTLYADANATYADAITVTNNMQTLITNYIALNTTLTAMKENATTLETLASQLNNNYTNLLNAAEALNSTSQETLILINNLIANCTAANGTQVQNLLDSMNSFIQNITALINSTNNALQVLNIVRNNVTGLENRMTVVENSLIASETIYNASLDRFLILNATYYLYLSEYTDQSARSTILNGLYNTYLARYTSLLTIITNFNAILSDIEATQTSIAADLVTNESRLLALEPDLCPNVTGAIVRRTNGFTVPLEIKKNMTAGTPVIPVSLEGKFPFATEARGVSFEYATHIATYANHSNTDLYGISEYIGIDASDSIYVSTGFTGSVTATWGPLNRTLSYNPPAKCLITPNHGSHSFMIQKLNQNMETVWAAHVGGTVAYAGSAVVKYCERTDTVWTAFHFGPVKECSDKLSTETIELYDVGATVPSFSHTYPTKSNASDASEQSLGLAQLSRSGRWLHFEVIRYRNYVHSDTFTHIGIELKAMDLNTHGELAFQALFESASVDGVWQFGDNFNYTTVGGSYGHRYHTVAYNTVTKTFQWVRPIADYLSTVRDTLSSADIKVDHNGDLYEIFFIRQSTGAIGASRNITLLDGSIFTFTIVAATGSIRFASLHSRSRFSDGTYIWGKALEGISNTDVRLTTPVVGINNQYSFVAITAEVFSGPHSIVYGGLNITIADPAAPEFSTQQMVLMQFSKLSAGSIIDGLNGINFERWRLAVNAEPDREVRESFGFVRDRKDRLLLFTQSDQNGRVFLTDNAGFEVIHDGQSDEAELYIRFGQNIRDIDYISSISGAGGVFVLRGPTIINSHGHIITLSVGSSIEFKGERYVEALTGTALEMERIVGMPALPAGFIPISILVFQQVDSYPMGIIAETAANNSIVDVYMRGNAGPFVPSIFDVDDRGSIFRAAPFRPETTKISSGIKFAQYSQIGLQTVNDTFLVDIHSTPVVGSDE